MQRMYRGNERYYKLKGNRKWLLRKEELFKKVEGRLHNYKFLEAQISNIELDIKKEKLEYRGCWAISYYERTGVTYNISRSVEKYVISKLWRITIIK